MKRMAPASSVWPGEATLPLKWSCLALLALCGLGASPVLAGGLFPKNVLVRVSLQSETTGLYLGPKYVPEARVLEVAEFDAVRLGGEGHLVSYIGNQIHFLDLGKVRATIRTLDGRSLRARILGVDDRLSLLFLKDESQPPPPGLHLSYETETTRFNLGKIVDNRLQVASPCVRKRVTREWLPLERLVVADLHPIPAGWRGATSVDLHGRWLGVIIEESRYTAGRRMATCELLPARVVLDALERIRKGTDRIAAGWLGVLLQQHEGKTAIKDVVADSPAERAGLLPGDVVVELDGHDFEDLAQLAGGIRWKGPSSVIRLTVRRGDGLERVRVALGRRRQPPKTGWKMVLPRAWNPGQELKEGIQIYRTPMPAILELGLTVAGLNPQLAAKFQSPTGGGLLITEVLEGSLAEEAGFRAGDVLYRVNGKEVGSITELQRCIEGSKGGTMTVQFVRDGEPQSHKIAVE